jgi:hypothetical protein
VGITADIVSWQRRTPHGSQEGLGLFVLDPFKAPTAFGPSCVKQPL